jgi:K+-sensing histidine kinase KdpD
LLAQAGKARTIESVIASDEVIEASLSDLIDRAIDAADITGIDIETSVQDVLVEVHPTFHLAVLEALENAIEHRGSTDEFAITLTAERRDGEVTLIITDSGPGIPQDEIDVLSAGTETNLQHGSGIGLWLMRWIVDRSNGTLTAERGDVGTRIRFRLNSAEEPT